MVDEFAKPGLLGSRTGRVLVVFNTDRGEANLSARDIVLEDPRLQKIHELRSESPSTVITAYVSTVSDRPVHCSSHLDGSFAIVDGELYGIDSEEPIASGTNQASRILSAYRRYGDKIFERVNMAASLVVWDAIHETLHVIRDRCGIVPSFFQKGAGSFFWASDLWTLLGHSEFKGFDYTAIDFFLANGFVPAPWTLVAGIEKLAPAHVLTVARDGRVRRRRYWPNSPAQSMLLTGGERISVLTDGFRSALEKRWQANGPCVAFLSGGVDSAMVVAGLKKWVTEDLHTVTIGYEEYKGRNDERAIARAYASALGTRHHEIVFGPRDVIDAHESMVLAHNAPFTWGLRAFFLSEIRLAGFRGLFGGDGPDAFYPSGTDLKAQIFRSVPRPIRNLILRSLLPFLRSAAPEIALKVSATAWCANTGLPVRCADRINPLYWRRALYRDSSIPPAAARKALELMLKQAAEYAHLPLLERVVLLHLRYFFAENTLAFNHWWMTWHDLQYKAPFCDNDLVDLVLARTGPERNKDEFRFVAESLFSDRIAQRPKVRVAVPISHWSRGPLRDFLLDTLTPAEIGRLEIIDPAGVRALLKQHQEGLEDHGMRIWALLTLITWARIAKEISGKFVRGC